MDFPAVTNIDDVTPDQVSAGVALLIAIGTLYCFLGYRTLKFVIGLTGFLIAGITAAVIVNWVTEGHLIAIGIALLIGGVSGTFAVLFLYKVGIFVLGLAGTGIIAYQVLSTTPSEWVPLAVLGIGVGGGLIALVLERPVVTVATAAIGAWLLSTCLAYFFIGTEWLADVEERLDLDNERLIVLFAWVVLTFAGVISQYLTHKPKEKK